MTEAQLRQIQSQPGYRVNGSPPAAPAAVPAKFTRDRMNKLEAAYAQVLELRRVAGEIKAWKFGSIKLRLANKAWYTPDFKLWMIGGETEFHETKGFWRDDARDRIKFAAETYPEDRFVAVTRRRKRDGGGWQFEEF